MKKKLILIVSTVAMAGALSLTLPSVFAQTNTLPPAAHHGERHPRIRGAIRALEAAKLELQHADHDFGGHRAAALEECDKAITQLQEALKYDKK